MDQGVHNSIHTVTNNNSNTYTYNSKHSSSNTSNIFDKYFATVAGQNLPPQSEKHISLIQQLAVTAHAVTSISQNVRRHRNTKKHQLYSLIISLQHTYRVFHKKDPFCFFHNSLK